MLIAESPLRLCVTYVGLFCLMLPRNGYADDWKTERFATFAQEQLHWVGNQIRGPSNPEPPQRQALAPQDRRPPNPQERRPRRPPNSSVRRADERDAAAAREGGAGEATAEPRSAISVQERQLIPVRRNFTASVPPLERTGSDETVSFVVLRSVKGAKRALPSFSDFRDWHRAECGVLVEHHFKILSVNLERMSATTDVLCEFKATRGGRRVDWNAHWTVNWRLGNSSLADEPSRVQSESGSPDLSNGWAIQHVDVRRVERCESNSALPLLRDRTNEVGAGLLAFNEQFSLGQAVWQRRIEGFHGMLNQAQQGIAVGDVDGDGRDDLYVCQPGGLPNRLFLHQADHSLVDVSHRFGVDLLDNSHAALFLDLDNDGDQDLVVSTQRALLVFSNSSDAGLELKSAMREVADCYTLCAADYDDDGQLDLFACSYFPDQASVESLPVPVPYFDARNGGRNVLLRNEGGLRFVDATASSGLDVSNRRFSYAATWVDYDLDGDQDLYVANDFGPDQLFRNVASDDGKRIFTDVSSEVGLQQGAFGMSVTAGDIDHDGDEDLYVANMFSSAGSRVTQQQQFRPAASKTTRQQFQRLANGNSLLVNERDANRLIDVGSRSGAAMGRWSWGANLVDLDNDSWLDLLVTNGYITGSDPDDL